MKTLVRSLLMMASFAFFAAGCAEDESADLTTSEDALNTCGGWHRGNHRGHRHHKHNHHGHGHHNHGGKGGNGGGAAGSTGAGGGSGGGMAGGSGGGTAGGTGGMVVDPRCNPVTSMVSWWHADGDYDDAIGANDGMTAGAASFGPGFDGQGFALTGGPNSFVEVPNDPSLQITGAITMDAWVNQTFFGGRIIDKVTAFSVDGYLLDVIGDRLRLFMGGEWVQSEHSLPLGSFAHVAGVYNGSTLAVYINGVLSNEIPTTLTSIPVSSNSFRIGADSTGGSLLNGVIDEPRVFNRALSAAEIAQIFWQGSNCR
jgi:hypothetical protein